LTNHLFVGVIYPFTRRIGLWKAEDNVKSVSSFTAVALSHLHYPH